MYKLISVIFVLLISLSLVACGESVDVKNNETIGMQSEFNNGEYFNDPQSVTVDNNTFYLDNGIWIKDKTGESVLITNEQAGHIATNGKTVYYTVRSVEDSKYKICCINVDGTDKRIIGSFDNMVRPVCVFYDVLYYTEYNSPTNDTLNGFNLLDNETFYVSNGASTVCSLGNRLYFLGSVSVIDETEAKLYYYDMEDKNIEMVSENIGILETVGNTLFYQQINKDEQKMSLKVYSVESGVFDNKLVLDKSGADSVLTLYVDEEFVLYSCDSELYRLKLLTGEDEQVSGETRLLWGPYEIERYDGGFYLHYDDITSNGKDGIIYKLSDSSNTMELFEAIN